MFFEFLTFLKAMREHVYTNFWAFHSSRLVTYINFDKKLQKFVLPGKKQKTTVTFIVSTIFFLLCVDSLYYVITNSKFTNIEIIYLMEMPGLIFCIVYYGSFVNSDSIKIINLIEMLQILDEHLLKRIDVKKNSHLTNYMVLLLNFIFLGAIITYPVAFFCHFLIPSLKMYTIQVLLAPFAMCLSLHLIIIACLLCDKIAFFNKIIIKFVRGNGLPQECYLCRDLKSKQEDLCKIHQMR